MAGDLGTEHGTAAFRRLLAEASSGEQARVDALVAFAGRTVFAATWPGQSQSVRTLTNRQGEIAMPLFTGRDLLESAATRFGWRNPDDSLPMRELPAREALRHAVARGVHFVVVDIGSDHSVEFSREEVEPLLQASPKGDNETAIRQAIRRSSLPPKAAVAPPSVDIDTPFATLKKNAAPAASAPGVDTPRSRAVTRPLGPAHGTRATAAMPAAPRSASQPRMHAAQPAAAAVRSVSRPMMPAVPPTAASAQSTPLPTLPDVPLPELLELEPAAQAPAHHMALPELVEPQAVPAAATAEDSALPALIEPEAAESEPPAPAADPAASVAALEVAAALTSAAKAAGDPAAVAAAEEMARLLLHNTTEQAKAQVDRPDPAQAAARRMAALFMGTPEPEPEAERESGEQPAGSHATEPSADLLQGISTALRGFPEVEWACVMHDVSDIPIVAVRVDPSFMSRVAQITDAVIGLAHKHGEELQVLLLSTPDLVRTARKDGKAFYPWKR